MTYPDINQTNDEARLLGGLPSLWTNAKDHHMTPGFGTNSGRPLLYDVFCGSGGASMGYSRAGFRVIGIDNNPKPLRHYPFESLCMDALEFLDRYNAGEFECAQAFHASPPCQHYSIMTKGRWQDRLSDHPDLIEPTRARLLLTKLPYVLENVVGAHDRLINPIMLCGTMFGLQTTGGNQLRRHRLFECPRICVLTPTCQHTKLSAIGVYGGGQNPSRRRRRQMLEYADVDFGIKARSKAMGIDWMVGDELSQAIPPAYTEYIGKYLLNAIANSGER